MEALFAPMNEALVAVTKAGAMAAYDAASGRNLLQYIAAGADNAFPIGDVVDVNGTEVPVVPCQPFIWDCEYLVANPGTENVNGTCSNYTNIYQQPQTLDWILAASAIVAMVMAYGIGANDSANSWGTSVGSGALPLLPAVVTGGVFEFLGAVLLGYGVSSTIRKGVASPDDPECWACGRCDSKMTLYMAAMFCSLCSAAIFLMICSFTAMPVSTTHAIIGGVVGATVVGTQDWSCLNWALDGGLGGIVLSWVISPVGSGMIAAIMYYIVDRLVLRSEFPEKRINLATPVLYVLTTFFIAMMILLKSKPLKKVPMEIKIGASVGVGLLAGALDFFMLTPFIKKRLPSVTNDVAEIENVQHRLGSYKSATRSDCPDVENGAKVELEDVVALSKSVEAEPKIPDDTFAAAKEEKKKDMKYWKDTCLKVVDEETAKELAEAAGQEAVHITEHVTPEQGDAIYYFKYMLVFVAALESFAHGANDTANATGAFSAVMLTWENGIDDCSDAGTPVWVMAVAGACVFAGVVTLGWRVIMTIGFSLTQVNYFRGYCVEFASTSTVVVFTILAIPVSTTHCQVGAVCAAGWVSFGAKHVKWSLFGRIAMTWVLTLPFAAILSGGLLGMISPSVLNHGEYKTNILGPQDFPQ